ncbi:MAG: DUF429 domain-containing protein [Spirochaetales bacterium]
MTAPSEPSEGFILGLDCAAQPERFGIALARIGTSSFEWLAAAQGQKGESIAKHCHALLRSHGLCSDTDSSQRRYHQNLTVALDAPLGWPETLAQALSGHHAGQPLPADSNTLFRRATDNVVRRVLGKRPLEVGADRIARAAVTALSVLGELREELGLALPVAVGSGEGSQATQAGGYRRARPPAEVALEVYPAALLMQADLQSRSYKLRDQRATRQEILGGLATALPEVKPIPGAILETALANADVMDALLCVVTGWLYLEGRCIGPEIEVTHDKTDSGLPHQRGEPAVRHTSREAIRREGWIWLPDRLR